MVEGHRRIAGLCKPDITPLFQLDYARLMGASSGCSWVACLC